MTANATTREAPRWMKHTLLAAGAYNIVWGAWVVLFPTAAFALFELPTPNYPELWQCIGMIVGVYGVGYAIASMNPFGHWPIVLVGLLGKVFGPIGFLWARLQGRFSDDFLWLIVFNDLIWWVPFFLILLGAYREFLADRAVAAPPLTEALSRPTSDGTSVAALSDQTPVLVAFLRHSGCTFCRADLEQLAHQLPSISARGWTLVVATMDSPAVGRALLDRAGLTRALHLSDPTREVYRAFGLFRGTLPQLFGFREILRGGWLAIFRGHGVGFLQGDGFQLGGLFLVHRRSLVYAAPSPRASTPLPIAAACKILQ